MYYPQQTKQKIILKYSEQEELLYNGKPCIYTDNNYSTEYNEYNYNINITKKRSGVSLKTVMRKINKYKNLTNETILLKIRNANYFPRLKMDLGVIFKMKPTNDIVTFNKSKIFTDTSIIKDGKIKEIIDILIKLDFNIFKEEFDENYDGTVIKDIFVVYGANRKIGITQFDDTIYGYTDAMENILYDDYDEFDKWSRCKKIPKSNSVNDIINEIIGNNPEVLAKKRKMILKKYKKDV
jgi:hypothetical protein